MGLFDWLFGQKQVDPEKAPLQTEWALPVFMDFLFSGFKQHPNGHWELQNLPQYPGQLTPTPEQTNLPDVSWMWQQGLWNPGNQFNEELLKSGGYKAPKQAEEGMMNLMQRGHQGGLPGRMQEEMATYGGYLGPVTDMMYRLAEYGAPFNAAGQYMANAAQFGIPSEAGRILHNRAMGVPTAATQFLLPYNAPPKR